MEHIVERAGRLHDKVVSFVEAMDGIGEGLARAQRSYATARDRLVDGRGNLIRQADQLRSMGAPVRKTLPAELLDRAGEPTSDDTTELAHPGSATPRLKAGD